MWKTAILVTGLFAALLFAQEETSGSTGGYGDDVMVVRSILDQCGMKDITVQDVAKIEEGRVVELNLSNRDVSKDGFDKIPAEIGKLTALRVLTCKGNIITSIPAEIGNCTQLQKLDFNSNRIGSLPPTIGNLVNLTDLDLRYNDLETLPAEIGNLSSLVYLRLWGNKLTSLTDAITKLTSLREIYLKDNRLTTLPLGITTMKSLTYYDIIGNKICKPDPKLEAWLVKKDKRYRETQKCW